MTPRKPATTRDLLEIVAAAVGGPVGDRLADSYEAFDAALRERIDEYASIQNEG